METPYLLLFVHLNILKKNDPFWLLKAHMIFQISINHYYGIGWIEAQIGGAWDVNMKIQFRGVELETTYTKHLVPETSIYKWLFKLDDSKSLLGKWLEITTFPSTKKWSFRLPGSSCSTSKLLFRDGPAWDPSQGSIVEVKVEVSETLDM